MTGLRILHLNSMLKGGGTDDRSVRTAHALMQLGHDVSMAGPQPPGLALGRGVRGFETRHVEAAINDMYFGQVAIHGRAIVPFRIVGFRVSVAFTQDLRHKPGNGN